MESIDILVNLSSYLFLMELIDEIKDWYSFSGITSLRTNIKSCKFFQYNSHQKTFQI